uniref:Elongation of very long chain fatty acids protein n=1 Tax=Pavo cristatus TaxID=9049 RepID=A0A8C9FNG2_PAVCR
MFLFYLLQFLMSGWATGYSFRCDIVDYSRSPTALRMVRTCWLYYFSKFIELLDTVSICSLTNDVLMLPFLSKRTAAAGAEGTFHALLNCIVHVIMYTYYGICSLGPAYHKYLWWKKYMTTIQLVQFILITAHIGQIYIMDDCPYQYPIFMFIIWLYGSMFLVLFLHFWYHAYTKGQRLPKMTRNGISKDE